MTAHKAHASAIVIALVNVVLMLLGVMPGDVDMLTNEANEGLTRLAAVGIEMMLGWLAVYYTRNDPR
jgi:hypothetical protein